MDRLRFRPFAQSSLTALRRGHSDLRRCLAVSSAESSLLPQLQAVAAQFCEMSETKEVTLKDWSSSRGEWREIGVVRVPVAVSDDALHFKKGPRPGDYDSAIEAGTMVWETMQINGGEVKRFEKFARAHADANEIISSATPFMATLANGTDVYIDRLVVEEAMDTS